MYATLDPLKHFSGELSDADFTEFKSSYCAGLFLIKLFKIFQSL